MQFFYAEDRTVSSAAQLITLHHTGEVT